MTGQQQDDTAIPVATQAEAADNACTYPGCGRERRLAGPGAGRPPAFCDLADASGKYLHTAKTAFRRRRELERAAAGDPVSEAEEQAPATFARQSAAEIQSRAVSLLEAASAEFGRLAERISATADPAAYEIEAEHAAAQWEAERGELHARAAEAVKAKHAAERRAAQADQAAEEIDAERQAAEDRAAEAARKLAEATEAHAREIERIQTDAQERENALREDFEHEIGIAEQKTGQAEAERQAAVARAAEAERAAGEAIAAAREEAAQQVAEAGRQAARQIEAAREETRAAGQRAAEAEERARQADHRAEAARQAEHQADQRTAQAREDHAAEITRLTAGWDREREITDARARDLTQALEEARTQLGQLRTELAESQEAAPRPPGGRRVNPHTGE